MKEVIIIGAGGHGRVVAEIVKANNDIVVGFLDDIQNGDGIIGRVEEYINYPDKHFVIGIGNNSVRKKIAETYPKLKWYTAIHPTAIVSKTAKIEAGTVVCPKAVINTGAIVGKHCIINTAATVEHDNVIGDFCHISPNSTLCGTVNIGECTHIGAGTVVRNNINIEKNIIVGIGAAVVEDLTDEGVYVGVPAKKMEGAFV